MTRPLVPLLLAGAAILSACGDDGVSPKPPQSRLAILPDSATTADMYMGDTVRLAARRLDAAGALIPNDTARFIWVSSDTTVVIVDDTGLAIVVGLGTADVSLLVADPASPATPSATDTATASRAFDSAPPVHHPGPLLTAATAAGHRCVVLASGQAECRGSDTRGQTGTAAPTVTTIQDWTAVVGGHTFSSISVSSNHTCALASDARAFCWGDNEKGQLAQESMLPTQTAAPIEVAGNHRWLSIVASGHAQTCGITTDQVPLCVGHNDMGQVGRAISYRDTLIAEYGTNHRMTMIITSHFYTCGLQTDGAVYCSGIGGDATNTQTSSSTATPARIGGTVPLTAIAIGYSHGCGIDATGRAHCWGTNGEGQLGTGDLAGSGTARPVTGGLTFARIYALEKTSCGVTAVGETWCWGSNLRSVLGRTRLARSTVPIRVRLPLGMHSIGQGGGLGSATACGVDGLRRLICWGGVMEEQPAASVSGPEAVQHH